MAPVARAPAMGCRQAMTSIEIGDPERSVIALILGLPLLMVLVAAARVRARSGLGYRRWAHARDAMRVTGLILLAASAGGLYTVAMVYVPVEKASVDQVIQAPSTFIITVDLSRSMEGSRLDAAKEVIGGVLEALGHNDMVVLLGFNASVFELCTGPPADCMGIMGELDNLAGGKYSAIGDAVATASTYARVGIPGVIIVVTDGGWNYGSPLDDAVAGAVSDELKVVIVRVGSDPRWAETARLAAKAGADVVDSGIVDIGELREFAREITVNAKIEAYTDYGHVPVETLDPTPGYATLLLGSLLLALGIGGRP